MERHLLTSFGTRDLGGLVMEGLRGSMVVAAILSLSLAAACSTTVTDGGGSSGNNPNNPSNPQNPSNPSQTGDGGTSSNPNDPAKPAASASEAVIDVDGTCPSFAACGGNPSGTYDYTAGCVEDVFKAARDQCPGLDTSKAKVTVKGSIYFLTSSALHREITVTTTGSITFPQSCTLGQCAMIQNGLKSSFDSV